ncbi:MAG: hypothetical protein ACTHJ4_04125 [Candidatus Nucleicultricaceae bacterium]
MTKFDDFSPKQYETYFLTGAKSEATPSGADAYYQLALDKIRGKGQTIVFNWPAFFLGGLWMVYRHLYGVALFALLFSLLLKAGLSFLLAPIFQARGWDVNLIDTVRWCVEAIIYGCFMTYVYFMTIHKDLECKREAPKKTTNLILSIMLFVLAIIVAIFLEAKGIKISYIFNSRDVVEMILGFYVLILFLLDRFVWRRLSITKA